MNWIPLAIAVGAVFGALSRYYVTLFWIQKCGDAFPYGTLFANLTGAFLIGLVSIVSIQLDLPIAVQKMLLVGFLGAYTTFSSYILDTAKLFQNNRIFIGSIYWLASAILGFFCVELGIWFAQQLS